MNPPPSDPRLARAVAWFESLTRDRVATLGDIYAENISFRDPFNDVRGLAAVERIYLEMYDRLDDPRFVCTETVVDERGALLMWDLLFRFRQYRRAIPQKIHGATHLKFDAAGKIVYHRDYWDAADELYTKLPVIGALMRWLKRRMA